MATHVSTIRRYHCGDPVAKTTSPNRLANKAISAPWTVQHFDLALADQH